MEIVLFQNFAISRSKCIIRRSETRGNDSKEKPLKKFNKSSEPFIGIPYLFLYKGQCGYRFSRLWMEMHTFSGERIMTKIRPAILVGFWLLLSSWGFSQTRFQGGMNFTSGFPLGAFKDNIDAIGLGANGYFTHRIAESPVSLGFSFTYLNYGRTKREEPISDTIPEVMVDIVTRNNIYLGHFLLRLQAPKGRLRPYLDGYGGFHCLSTNTALRSQGIGSETIASHNISRDFTPSYGAGSGLMIRVHEARNERFAVDLEIGARYLRGGKADYLKEGSIRLEDNGYVYDFYRSNTNLMSARFGICFSF